VGAGDTIAQVLWNVPVPMKTYVYQAQCNCYGI